MNEHILLTAAQAAEITGEYGEYSAIVPVPYLDGFIVPFSLIDNPEFSAIKTKLQGFVTAENVIIPEPVIMIGI
jgi:hypothetical protein